MTQMAPFSLFFLFLAGHALADYALQTEWIATNKNRHVRKGLSPEAQKQMQIIWPHLLTAHSLHHGLIVYLVSQSITLGVAETVAHWLIDFGKCEKWYGFHTDQALHVVCKILWVLAISNSWV